LCDALRHSARQPRSPRYRYYARSSISEDLAQIIGRLVYGAPDCWCLGDRIEQHEVMDGPVVADRRDPHARRCKLSPISFAFVAEHVILIDEKQCLRQALELLGGGVESCALPKPNIMARIGLLVLLTVSPLLASISSAAETIIPPSSQILWTGCVLYRAAIIRREHVQYRCVGTFVQFGRICLDVRHVCLCKIFHAYGCRAE
jgi:hypothetical protein